MISFVIHYLKSRFPKSYPSLPNSTRTIEESTYIIDSKDKKFKTKADLSNGQELLSKEIERKLLDSFEYCKQEVTKELTKMHLK